MNDIMFKQLMDSVQQAGDTLFKVCHVVMGMHNEAVVATVNTIGMPKEE